MMAERKRERILFAQETKKLDWTKVILSGTYKIGRIVIWGAINEDGPCGVRLFDDVMSPQEYISILDKILWPMWCPNDDLVLMQNQFNYDYGHIIRDWFDHHPQVKFFNWPATSDDFNPMHYVWSRLRRILEFDLPTKNKNIILDGWHELKDDSGYYYDLLSSQANVIRKVINKEAPGTL